MMIPCDRGPVRLEASELVFLICNISRDVPTGLQIGAEIAGRVACSTTPAISQGRHSLFHSSTSVLPVVSSGIHERYATWRCIRCWSLDDLLLVFAMLSVGGCWQSSENSTQAAGTA